MTEYGAPITTSETYYRDTASKATHSVLISGKPGRKRPQGSQLGQGYVAGVRGAKGILRLLSRGKKLYQ